MFTFRIGRGGSNYLVEPFLSVVIPAFNEELRITETLAIVTKYLAAQDYEWEVIVADDGSTDHTALLVGQVIVEHSNVRILRLAQRGKGRAVTNASVAAERPYRFMLHAA